MTAFALSAHIKCRAAQSPLHAAVRLLVIVQMAMICSSARRDGAAQVFSYPIGPRKAAQRDLPHPLPESADARGSSAKPACQPRRPDRVASCAPGHMRVSRSETSRFLKFVICQDRPFGGPAAEYQPVGALSRDSAAVAVFDATRGGVVRFEPSAR